MSLVIVRDLYKYTCILCILLSSCFKIVLCLWNKSHIFCRSNHFLRLAWLSLHCDLRIYCSCTPQTQNNTRLKSLWKRDLKTQISFFPVYITQIPISLCKFSLTFMWFKYFHENLITTRMIEPMVNKYTFRLFRINNAVILYRISANSPLLSSPR